MLFNNADISNGVERVPIRAKNRYNFASIPSFDYIRHLEVPIELMKQFKKNTGCNCKRKCTKTSCKCYENNEFFIKFCDPSICACSTAGCDNQVGDLFDIKVSLEVYFVNPEKGWGIRCDNDIKKGTILFEYAGVLLEDSDSNSENDYLFYLEYENKKYIIDAYEKGNATRFINHCCLPNLRPILVVGDESIPHIVFTAMRDILHGEELTFNYGPLWWNAKSTMKCVCCSPFCEYQRL